MNTITVKQLADELGVSVSQVSLSVSALCRDAEWGPSQVVARAAVSNGASQLFAEAAEEIRALLAAEAVSAA